MGWIRDLMQRPEAGGQRSFGDAARRCLAHPGWPADAQPKPRSLASMLGRFDRELDLDWLRTRPEVQQVLADVLAIPVSDVQLQCQRASAGWSPGGDQSLQLLDAPYARSLRLKEEPLPPGLPWLPQRVAAWGAVWWFAPSGSGRSLVGQALRARGEARWVEARSWADAAEHVVEPGPVYVELHSPASSESLLRAPPRDKLCVAADFLPESSEWTVVVSAPVKSYLEPLIDWLKQRLPADSRLEPMATQSWLLGMPAGSGVLDSFGSALGLLGLVDELGLDQVRSRSLNQLAQAFLKYRTAKLLGDNRLLKARGFELLTGLTTQALTESSHPLDMPRSEDEWLELVPAELSREVDVEWIKRSLARAGTAITERELERATQALPPGGYRVVRALHGAGLLQAGADQRMSIRPRWLACAAREASLRELFTGTPYEWGEALLAPSSTRRVLAELRRRLRRDPDAVVEGVLELEASASAAYAAALEALVRVLGLSPELLTELSRELLESLWREQLELVVEAHGCPPLPRIEYPAEVTRAEPMLARGAWYVALWSIAERITGRAAQANPLLNPWRADAPAALSGLHAPSGAAATVTAAAATAGAAAGDSISAEQLTAYHAVLDAIASWLKRGPEVSSAEEGGAEELLFRLFSRRGTRAASHPLHQPARAVECFRAGILTADALSPWSAELLHQVQLGTARAEAELVGFINAAARAFAEGGYPEGGLAWFCEPHESALGAPAQRTWPHLQAAELAQLLTARELGPAGLALRVPWRALTAEQWALVADLWVQTCQAPVGSRFMLDAERMLEYFPGESAAAALAAGADVRAWPASVLSRAWESSPELMGRLRAQLDVAPLSTPQAKRVSLEGAKRLLDSAPDRLALPALELLRQYLPQYETDEQLLGPVVLHLQARVATRSEGWRAAYEMLDDLQARRLRLSRLERQNPRPPA